VITERRTCGTVNPFPIPNNIPTETIPDFSRTHGRRCRGGRRVSEDPFVLGVHWHFDKMGSRGGMGVEVEMGWTGGKGR
jgi:hypothetical protein